MPCTAHRYWQRIKADNVIESLPRATLSATTAVEPLMQQLHHVVPDPIESLQIPRHSKILLMPTQLPAQRVQQSGCFHMPVLFDVVSQITLRCLQSLSPGSSKQPWLSLLV